MYKFKHVCPLFLFCKYLDSKTYCSNIIYYKTEKWDSSTNNSPRSITHTHTHHCLIKRFFGIQNIYKYTLLLHVEILTHTDRLMLLPLLSETDSDNEISKADNKQSFSNISNTILYKTNTNTRQTLDREWQTD